jgi:hypothetical protein
MHVSPFFSLVAADSRVDVEALDGPLASFALRQCLRISPLIRRDDSRV